MVPVPPACPHIVPVGYDFGGLPADHCSSADETRPRNKNARPTFAGQSFGMIKTISLKRMPGLAVLKHVLRCPKQGESIPRIFGNADNPHLVPIATRPFFQTSLTFSQPYEPSPRNCEIHIAFVAVPACKSVKRSAEDAWHLSLSRLLDCHIINVTDFTFGLLFGCSQNTLPQGGRWVVKNGSLHFVPF